MEHETLGEATVQVLRGRVRLSSGDMVFVPDARHGLEALEALEDSAILLTVARLR